MFYLSGSLKPNPLRSKQKQNNAVHPRRLLKQYSKTYQMEQPDSALPAVAATHTAATWCHLSWISSSLRSWRRRWQLAGGPGHIWSRSRCKCCRASSCCYGAGCSNHLSNGAAHCGWASSWAMSGTTSYWRKRPQNSLNLSFERK